MPFGLLGYKQRLGFLLFHILLGLISTISPWFLSIWIWISIIRAILSLYKLNSGNMIYALFPLAYVSGLEIAARVANSSPLVPYEFAKYFYLLYLILCINKFNRAKSYLGLVLIFLLLPSTFLIPIENFSVYFVNSFLGIFLLSLMAFVWAKKQIHSDALLQVFYYYMIGLVALLTQVVAKASNLDELEYSLGANFETAGGFGSNQVSTQLGIGFFLFAVVWLLGWTIIKEKKVAFILMLGFLFRAILTFSRGGVLGPLTAIAVAYIIPKSGIGLKKLNLGYLITIAGIIMVVFLYADNITGNLLSKRYQGHTAGTLEGTRELDLNVLTSRRSSLMETEWQIFKENPVFGVGPGAGYEAREKLIGIKIASHTEATRLLAEHGVLGLFVAAIFLFYPLYHIFSHSNGLSRFLSSAFFVLALFTSFHAGMRTTVTPFFWGLACMRFIR
jgi:hypothetical protein